MLNVKTIKNITSSENGFTSIYFILFITLLLAFSVIFNIIFFASQSKDAFRNQCLIAAVDLEKDIINYENEFLLLNIPSTALRIQLAQAYIKLAAVPWPANLAILIEIEEINLAQEKLDQLQLRTINAANLAITLKLNRLITEINSSGLKITSLWSKYVGGFQTAYPANIPQLAVKPDSIGGLAPNYILTSDYKKKQSVEVKWNHLFWLTAYTHKILNVNLFGQELKAAPNSSTKYSLTCLVEAERTNLEWQLKIKLDRP